jgi:signal transduction histidine kinase
MKLREKLEKTREEWLTGVSHDLKTPLSTIKGYIDILAAKKYQLNEAEFDQILETTSQRIEYIEELLADFTLTFQLKNNALPIHREEENIVELVRESVIDLVNHPEADSYDIQFESMVDEVIDRVDKKWYKRAIDNLLGNAFLHNPKGTRIVVTIDRLEKGYEIVIADNGKGMDEETQARLFERYFRGTHSGSEVSGSGLGMAIAYQLIGIHGGKIKLQSALGQGTEIRIHFSQTSDGTPGVETDKVQ